MVVGEAESAILVSKFEYADDAQGITFEKARRATNHSLKNDDLEPRELFVL